MSPSLNDHEERIRRLEASMIASTLAIDAHARQLESLEPVVDQLATAAASSAAVQLAMGARRERVQRAVSMAAGAAGVAGLAFRFLRV